MDEIIKNSFKTFFHHKIHDFGDMKMHKNLCQQLVPGSHDFILIFPVLITKYAFWYMIRIDTSVGSTHDGIDTGL